MPTLQPYDTIALAEDIPEHGLLRGQVGSVVDVYGERGVEVEFVDAQGKTYAILTLDPRKLIRLYFAPLKAAS